jgi:prolipoprotein diacylglyceryltransferase
MAQIYRREQRDLNNLSELLVYLMFGTVIGARLGHVVEGCFDLRLQLFIRLGQQVNEYVAEQASDSKADQDENDLF